VRTPLKTALTGLELLLARSRLWEDAAAKAVSLAPQLEQVAGLATRWRRLELASWRRLLCDTIQRHARGERAPRQRLRPHTLHAASHSKKAVARETRCQGGAGGQRTLHVSLHMPSHAAFLC
jgi:hypothetical protein